MGGLSVSAAINDTQSYLQELQLLASPLANAQDYLQVRCLKLLTKLIRRNHVRRVIACAVCCS